MLLEQAFHALPEILCGSRYPGQDYEAGVVTALTMAVLQELNGRNVPNPLSCIQGERLYEDRGFASGAAARRYLRADLVLDTGPLRVANKRLGKHYGWRHQNWLEAKFFRVSNKPTNKTAPTASLLADLLRLATLVPEKPGHDSFSGRYLLHIYDRPPADYISSRRNSKGKGQRGSRAWAKLVHVPGSQEFTIDELDKEPSSFQKVLGAMGGLSLKLSVTNILLEPRSVSTTALGTVYWCVLTRIDTVECIDGTKRFTIAASRAVAEDSAGDFQSIRARVALSLGEVPDAEREKPEDPAITPDPDTGPSEGRDDTPPTAVE
jgi:hypothetical protein